MEAVKNGRAFVVDFLSPVNTLFFFSTGILIPALDLMRPRTFLLAYATAAAVLFFLTLLVLRWRGKPRPEAISKALVTTVGVCTALFALSAVASTGYPSGFLASKNEAFRDVQSSLLGIKEQNTALNEKLDRQTAVLASISSGKSPDPRVELRNLGVAWDTPSFLAATDRGDLRVIELFLAGGMPFTQPGYMAGNLTVPARAVFRNAPRIVEQLQLFERYGFQPTAADAVLPSPLPSTPPSLYGVAVESKNSAAADYLRGDRGSVARYDDWKAQQLALEKKRRAGPYVF